ncbi:putative phosphothreonine lyase domain-containing protein [Streptomyces sp. NPDC001205]
MREEPTRPGQSSATAPQPAADIEHRWQWAMAPGPGFSSTGKSGKWLWFLPVRALDAGWHRVKTAVEAGQLGPQAKVATLRCDFDGDPTRRPVSIYTDNHEDEEDVRRVLEALRSLGIRDQLAYKPDEATERGEYGAGTSIYISPAGTTKVIRCNRQHRTAPQAGR